MSEIERLLRKRIAWLEERRTLENAAQHEMGENAAASYYGSRNDARFGLKAQQALWAWEKANPEPKVE